MSVPFSVVVGCSRAPDTPFDGPLLDVVSSE